MRVEGVDTWLKEPSSFGFAQRISPPQSCSTYLLNLLPWRRNQWILIWVYCLLQQVDCSEWIIPIVFKWFPTQTFPPGANPSTPMIWPYSTISLIIIFLHCLRLPHIGRAIGISWWTDPFWHRVEFCSILEKGVVMFFFSIPLWRSDGQNLICKIDEQDHFGDSIIHLLLSQHDVAMYYDDKLKKTWSLLWSMELFCEAAWNREFFFKPFFLEVQTLTTVCARLAQICARRIWWMNSFDHMLNPLHNVMHYFQHL